MGMTIDCVSRAEVLKLMQDNWRTHNGDWAMQESMDDIRALPSVTPQPRKGHWYRQTNDYVDYYECSECGMAMGIYDVKNYCPNCGSRNEVEV